MLQERGTVLLRPVALTSAFARARKQKALGENIVHILGSLRRHCNFLAFWWFQEWELWP